MIELVTATGAKYHIDLEHQFWRKISRDGRVGHWDRLWAIKHSAEHNPYPWEEGSKWQNGVPAPDEHLFISSRDNWWISTLVVSVEEVESVLTDD